MKLLRFIPLAFAAYTFNACNNHQVKITNKNFDAEINQQQNLLFTMSKELAHDSLLNKWDTTEYIKFTPAVRGKFKWVSKNELLFSPEVSFKASTAYKAELQDYVVEKNSSKLKVAKDKIDFHTPFLTLASSSPFWTISNAGKPELHLNLNFNYKTSPQDLKKLLSVAVEGKNIPLKMITNNPDRNIEVALESGDLSNQKATIQIEKGLACGESDFKTSEVIKNSVVFPDKEHLEILEAKAEYDGLDPYVWVATNQAISAEQIQNLVNISPQPESKTYFEVNSRGFLIKGNFVSGQTYTIQIPKNLKGLAGGVLKEDFTQEVAFGKLQPQIAFTEKKAMYLTSKGHKNIGVKITNVPKIKVEIYKIYENNIQSFLKNFSYNLESESVYSYGYENYEDYGTPISSQEYETDRLPITKNGIHLLNISTQKLQDFKGAYAIMVGSTDNLYQKAFKLVAISDVGLIAKENADEIVVFANSILDTKPLKDVNISILSSNNQILVSQKTDADGVVKIADLKKKYPDFKVKMITATYADDFTFLDFEKSRVENSRYELGGLRSNEANYQAFVHLERDLYRPNEQVHFSVILRNHQWKPEAKMPLKAKFILPNGKEFMTMKGTLSEQGSWESSLQLPESALTGTYTMEIYTLNDILLNTSYISVEEFMPDRIKIKQSTEKTSYTVGEKIVLSGEALNLYGTPAANRNYQVRFAINRKQFAPKGFEKYNFQMVGKIEALATSEIKEGTTDKNGKYTEEFAIAKTYTNQGLFEATLYSTVFDETGRPVYKNSRVEIVTQPVMLGMERVPEYIDTDQNISVGLVALDKDGKNAETRAVLQLVQYEWQNVAERDYEGNIRYVSNKKEKIISEQTLRISGKTAYPFRVARSGEYELRIRNVDAENYVSQTFFAYGFGMTDYSSFEVNKDGQVDISADKDRYEVGDNAKLLFKAPFEGKILVSVERNKVLEHFYLSTDKKSASLTLKIKDEHLPNMYISATLIKPLTNSAIPLTVAHGYLPLTVEAKKHKMDVKIEAAASSYSNTKQTIKVKTSEGNAEVVVAVVDEGILQIKDFKNPNPYDFFFQKRALEVNAYDLYPRLFPELSAGKSSVGGDGDGRAESANNKPDAANPMGNKRVKLVSFWSGVLKTNSSGEVSYTIDIPQFSGSLRIMAVAHKGSSFGGNATNMKVADPVVISSAIPRFLSPQDEVLIPVTLSNTTTTAMQGNAQISVGKGLSVLTANQESVMLEANSEKQVFFKIKTGDFVGNTQIVVSFNAQNKKFEEKTDIGIRPATPLQKKTGFGSMQAGSNQNITLQSPFLSGTDKASLIVSNSTMAQFSDNLDYLLQYPYGCVEQTISTAFPQLYAGELSKQLKSRNAEYKGISAEHLGHYHIQQAISKLQTMQLYNGALSYWQGYESETWWGTAYGAHFLYEAKKAGYSVNEPFLERLAQYLEKKVKEKAVERYYYYDDNNKRYSRTIISKEVPYTLYVLGLMRRGDIATMNYCKANSSMLAIDGKYLLAATYLMMGDKNSYQALLPKSFSGERSENALSGSFYSYIRDEAISLNALLEVDSRNVQIPVMAKHLSEQMKAQKNLNTQESAFALLAMGKLARQANQSDMKASIKVQGKEIAKYENNDLVLSKNLLGNTLNISSSGKGTLYYFWEIQGMPQNPNIKEEDSYLKVRRTFYNQAGQELKNGEFTQNDLIVVKVSIQTTDGSSVPNVAITDLLPAGLEIENTRLVQTASLPWIKDATTPDYVDIKDDRIHIFCEANATTKTFYYMTRAVSIGSFQMGALSAEAMYASEYHSYYGARKVVIASKVKKETM
jgi:uncharacterized protein YfaS (alpha-2-macroglobulin family)